MPENNPFRDKTADNNPFRTGVKTQLAEREAELAKTETPTPAIDRGLQQFFDNTIGQALSFPGEVLGKGIAGTAAAVEGAGAVLTGGDFDFNRRANEQLQRNPAAALNALPSLTFNEAQAFSGTVESEIPKTVRPIDQIGPDGRPIENPVPPLSERFGPAFDDELARINQEQQRIEEKFPFRTSAGKVGGDILTLMSLRGGFANRLNIAETAAFNTRKFADSMRSPGARRRLESWLDSDVVARLKRGTGRAAETTAEATIMSLLKDADPIETATIAAVGQVGGSLVLEAFKTAKRNPWKAAIAFGTLIKMSEEIVPGEDASWVSSIESGWSKVQLTMALGIAAALSGAGRGRGGAWAEDAPMLIDAIATIPRAASISFITDYTQASPEEKQTVDAVIDRYQQDPEFFGPEITQKLEKAFENGTLVQALREPL